MKKIIVITCCAFTLFACEKNVKSSQTLHKLTTNTTTKNLYYEVKTDVRYDGVFVNALDSAEMIFYREKDISLPFGTSTVRLDQIKITQETVFNLTDTSKYDYNIEYEMVTRGNTKEERVYARHLSSSLGNQSTDINSVIMIKLNVTDSILDIMQKDYSMLDKFKEYYSE